MYNATLSAQAAATNLSSSLKHQHQIQAPPQITTASKDTEKLMEIEKLRKKLEDTEKAMAKLIAEMNSDQYEAKVRFGKRCSCSKYFFILLVHLVSF